MLSETIGSKKLDIGSLIGGGYMVEKKVADVVLRPKRQVTLPKEICDQLGIGPGDVLEMTVEDSIIVARPRKIVALEALREIQQAFQRSGITEGEVQKTGRRMRQEVARERYGVKD
jgi:AbrB family looped-hinge helix DNA binding protein